MKKSEMIKAIETEYRDFLDQIDLNALLDFLVSKGMLPPPYFKTVLTGPPAKEGVSNLVLLSRVEKCEGWEPEDEQ